MTPQAQAKQGSILRSAGCQPGVEAKRTGNSDFAAATLTQLKSTAQPTRHCICPDLFPNCRTVREQGLNHLRGGGGGQLPSCNAAASQSPLPTCADIRQRERHEQSCTALHLDPEDTRAHIAPREGAADITQAKLHPGQSAVGLRNKTQDSKAHRCSSSSLVCHNRHSPHSELHAAHRAQQPRHR